MQRHVVLFLCFAMVAIFIAGLLAIATPSDALEARVVLEGPLTRWQKLGGSDNPATLAPPRVPDAENAAPLYRRAFAELGRLKESERERLDMHTLRTRPQHVITIASRLDPAVTFAHEAVKRSGCEWNRDFYRTGALTQKDLDEFDQFVRLAVAVAAHAMEGARRSDFASAFKDLVALRRMAGHAVSHPHVTQASMGLFIDMAAFDVLEWGFRQKELSVRAGGDVAAFRNHRAAMRRTLLTHGTACLLPLDDPAFGSPASGDASQRDRAKAWFLDVMCAHVNAIDEPGAQVVPVNTVPEGLEYARVFVPPPTLIGAVNIAATRNDMAVAAIKLRSHRATTGDYPDSWVVPTNPDTGIVLQYRRDGDGFVLSAGTDKKLDWRWN